jgi:hypothetical protein
VGIIRQREKKKKCERKINTEGRSRLKPKRWDKCKKGAKIKRKEGRGEILVHLDNESYHFREGNVYFLD